MVTSLPARVRTKLDNIIIAGIWLGGTKPNINVLLSPIINTLSSNGIAIKLNGLDVNIKPMLVMGIFDLPAQQLPLTQYNSTELLDVCTVQVKEPF